MNTTRETMRLFWQHAWRYKQFVIAIFTLIPLANLTFRFLPPLVIASILQRISQGDFVKGDLWASFGPSLLLYMGLNFLGGVLLWRLAVICVWKLEMLVIRDIHQRVFNHLLLQSANFHADRFAGSLVSQANKLTGAYVRFADTIWFQMSGLVLSFIFTVVILAPRVPWIALAILLFSVAFMWSAVLITKYVRQLNTIEASKQNTQTGLLADVITNVLAIKSFASGRHERAHYATATEVTRSATRDVMRASVKRDFYFSGATLVISTLSLVLATAGVVLFDADIATVFLVINYTSIITQGLWEFCQSTLRSFNRALGDASDMVAILQITPEILDPPQPETVRIHQGAIDFKNVQFAHDGSDALFQGLSLSIRPGEKIGLVGHSGSGKTTFTKLLLRFADIDGGEILIDGQNIAKITQDDLRRHIAYVPQEPLLFHRSVRENIAYGKPGASEAEIDAAARRAHAADFIEQLPRGYQTLVGERGVKLSGGQRQRIAIARAILKNAPILMLDEATSALDSESELLIQDALWKLMEGRTTIVIAHRLSTIQKMDRIVVLDNGNIVEQGSHHKLLAQGGTYAKLWAHQSGGFIEE